MVFSESSWHSGSRAVNSCRDAECIDVLSFLLAHFHLRSEAKQIEVEEIKLNTD
jgi:hypothetical protein